MNSSAAYRELEINLNPDDIVKQEVNLSSIL